MTVTVGEDGLARCAWVGVAPQYLTYHDQEWGQIVHGEQALYERLTLEAFQSGLSWITILRKRDAFRAAFAGFDPDRVARFTDEDRARLLADTGIVRNAAKIDAAIANAVAVIALRAHGGLDELIWSHAPADRQRDHQGPVPAVTAESTALAKSLRAKGFRFVGPTTAYAAMQACGLVDDHDPACHCRTSS